MSLLSAQLVGPPLWVLYTERYLVNYLRVMLYWVFGWRAGAQDSCRLQSLWWRGNTAGMLWELAGKGWLRGHSESCGTWCSPGGLVLFISISHYISLSNRVRPPHIHSLEKKKLLQSYSGQNMVVWNFDWTVKKISCSSREARIDSHHQHGSSQPSGKCNTLF